jgi:hypothetical protein
MGSPTGLTLRELLAASAATHRRAVAAAVGVGDASAAALARALGDRERLAALVGGLHAEARAAATALAFTSPLHSGPGHVPRASALGELERHGLAFAFGGAWARQYVVPVDLVEPLRSIRAAAHAQRLRDRAPRVDRWVAAPLQTAHDAAALWAFLARAPARVKADGTLYARTVPKLIDALPPIEGVDATGFATMRLELALDWLRAHGFLRLLVADGPRQDGRRELAPAGDLPGGLRDAADGLQALLTENAEQSAAHAIAGALARALGGRDLALGPLGEALAALLDEAAIPAYHHHDDLTRALSAFGPLWLAGGLSLGVDARSEPIAARFAVPTPAERPAGERFGAALAAAEPAGRDAGRAGESAGRRAGRAGERAGRAGAAASASRDVTPDRTPLGVCQSSFEVVCLRTPTPAERAELALAAEPVPGQAHVFRVTRAAARCAERALGPRGAAAALERLVGDLPQNVARSVEDWVRDVRAPLRLRTAIFLDAGEPATADALASGPLAGLAVERLGPALLAVPAHRLGEVERALAAAGQDVEPGVDRVSGAWVERPDAASAARAAWAPDSPDSAPSSAPLGKLVSTLAEAPLPADHEGAPGLSPEAESLTVILQALEEEADVEILYAGKRGLTLRRVTPLEIQGEALHAWCHLRDDERAFWLRSIRGATLADG